MPIMYFCSMVFVYPYIRTADDWDIMRSINWLLAAFPQANIYTIGDAIPGTTNIPHKKRYTNRGADVSDKILTYARAIGGEFVYMNDDFFINANFQPGIQLQNGHLQINSSHSPNYQQATKNTLEFLSYYGHTTHSYECHQPMLLDSSKLLELFDQITWQEHNHFIKSLYANVYPGQSMPGDNLKIGRPDILKANELLHKYGCFSISDEFKQRSCIDFLNRY